MRIETFKGNKGKGDSVILVNGEQITYMDFLRLSRMFFKLEDKIYPQPRFQGRWMLVHALIDAASGMSDSHIRRKYKLRG